MPLWGRRVYLAISDFTSGLAFGPTHLPPSELALARAWVSYGTLTLTPYGCRRTSAASRLSFVKFTGGSRPADLLTKLLPSRDKLEQLVVLFRCASRVGRAVSAPFVRKRVEDPGDEPREDECEDDIIEDSDAKGVMLVHKAAVHDTRAWPHTHSSEAVDRFCPLVPAAEAI